MSQTPPTRRNYGLISLAAESFSFAGLSPPTTVEAAKKRYPRSSFMDRHVYISEEDSHDHIYGLDLADGGDARIRIWFERPQREHHEYPRCEQVAAVIKKQYGEPAVVQEFDEERSRNRRLIWRRSEEELSLLCFRMGRQPFFAADRPSLLASNGCLDEPEPTHHLRHFHHASNFASPHPRTRCNYTDGLGSGTGFRLTGAG